MSVARSLLMAAAVMLSMLAFGGGTVGAQERVCTGRIGNQTVDNVRVPNGATCTLAGTVVRGSVWVGSGAQLRAGGAQIGRDVKANGFAYVRISSATSVGGSIDLENGGAFVIDNVRVADSIEVERNSGKSKIARSTINGSVDVEHHSGGISIGSNSIGDDLDCEGNNPRPTGSGNTVRGDKEGQCHRRL